MDLLNAAREQIQSHILHQVYDFGRKGAKRILVQGATGIGKTWIGGRIALGSLKRGRKVMFVTPRRRLTKQMHGTLCALGMEPSYLMAGERHDRSAEIQVVCDATLKGMIRRAQEAKKSNNLLTFCRTQTIKDILPPADTIIVDECHIGDIHWLTEHYPDSIFIGMSATPMKADGTGLGDQYEALVHGPQVSELISLGILLPSEVVSSRGLILPDRPDVDEVPLLGEVVDNWRTHANGERTVLYAKSVGHSKYLCEKFIAAGVPAEHIDSTISDVPEEGGLSERERIYNRLSSGEIKVLCNYGIVVEGVDIPEIGCVILARPNKDHVINWITYQQTVGRGRRIHGKQPHLVVIDHTRTEEKLGHPDKDWEWKLNTTKNETVARINQRKRDNDEEKSAKTEKLVKCVCGASYSPAPKCPECDRPMPEKRHVVEEIPVELVKQGSGKKPKLAWNEEAVKKLYGELMGAYQTKKDPYWLSHAKTCADKRIPENLRLDWLEYKRVPPMTPSDVAISMVNNDRRAYYAKKNAVEKKKANSSA